MPSGWRSRTPLMYTSEIGDFVIVGALSVVEADVDKATKDRTTSLLDASCRGAEAPACRRGTEVQDRQVW